MLTNEQTLDRYTRLARMAGALPRTDDYQRGYLQGLRSRYHREQFGFHDEHARWIEFGDSPAYPEFGKGYRDGLAASEPQP
jgi:hypothetical protein